MPQFTSLEIAAWVSSFLWPLFRIASLLMVMPIIGAQFVPMRVRLVLGVMITLIVAPLLDPVPVVDVLSPASWIISGQQIIIGSVMGFILQMFFHIFALAGQMISMQMGLGFASVNDPASGVNVAAVGQFYLFMTTLLFLAMNGHLVVIEIVVESFRTLPIGQFMPGHSLMSVVLWLGWIFASAMLLAIPAMTALLIINITFGVMAKSAPQLNVFALAFPLSMIFGVFIIWVSFSDFFLRYLNLVEAALFMLRQVVAS